MKEQERYGDDLTWEETGRELVAPCRIFDLYRVERRAPDGRRGSFYLLDAPEWATVIPFFGTEEELAAGTGDFLMVEQYRHGLHGVTIEFPAGTVDAGEEPADCARRELLEETGRRARQLVRLGSVCPNPAFMNNRVHFYLALGLEEAGDQSLDEHEEIVLHRQPVGEVLANMGGGRYDNGVMMMAVAYLQRWRAERAVR